jgi:hypothetical protein
MDRDLEGRLVVDELECLRLLAPLASPDTRRHVHQAMLEVKAGRKGVKVKRFKLARVGRSVSS